MKVIKGVTYKRRPQKMGAGFGRNMDSVPIPEPVAHTPMEDAEQWYNITTSPIESNTTQFLVRVQFNGTTNPIQAIARTLLDFVDGSISCMLRYEGTTTDTQSYPMTIRMTDSLNFIGLRSYSGELQVVEVVGGVLVYLIRVSNSGSINMATELRVTGDQVQLVVNGLSLGVATTTITSGGRAGCAPGFWDAGVVIVADNYRISG